jgi:hypothetical protein
MKLTGKNWSSRGKNLSQCQFVHHKSHMDWPVIGPRPRGERPETNRLSHGTAKSWSICIYIYMCVCVILQCKGKKWSLFAVFRKIFGFLAEPFFRKHSSTPVLAVTFCVLMSSKFCFLVVKPSVRHYGNSTEWGCLRTECWEQCVDVRGR